MRLAGLKRARATSSGCILAAVLAIAPAAAHAGGIEVTTTADQHGSKKGDCALREAVVAANRDDDFGGCKDTGGGDVIQLGAKTYRLTRSGSGEENAKKGDLDVTGKLALEGAGAKKTRIDAGDASDRHLDLKQDSKVSVSDLTLEKGSLDEFTGGAISAFQAKLQITHVTIRKNFGPGGSGAIAGSSAQITITKSVIERNRAEFAGGGITTTGGDLAIVKSRISDNRTGLFGGGVYPNNTDVRITKSVIEGNEAENVGGGLYLAAGTTQITESRITGNESAMGGGGIHAFATTGEIRGSEISGNRSSTNGGGLEAQSSDVGVLNSTVSGNESGANGGGFHLTGSSTEVIMNNVTIAANKADSDSNGTGSGGGIFVDAGTAFLANGLLGDNAIGSTPGAEPDCDGGIIATFTLIENNCPGLGSDNIVGVDPLLRPLALNGGLTKTHELRSNSLAIDAANPSLPGSEDDSCLPNDQRGEPRPTGECDMGAFERG